MKKHRKIILICLLLLANSKAFSQVEASFYTGFGTVTNLGGILGTGLEVKYEMSSTG
jgi:hypothetical protein